MPRPHFNDHEPGHGIDQSPLTGKLMERIVLPGEEIDTPTERIRKKDIKDLQKVFMRASEHDFSFDEWQQWTHDFTLSRPEGEHGKRMQASLGFENNTVKRDTEVSMRVHDPATADDMYESRFSAEISSHIAYHDSPEGHFSMGLVLPVEDGLVTRFIFTPGVDTEWSVQKRQPVATQGVWKSTRYGSGRGVFVIDHAAVPTEEETAQAQFIYKSFFELLARMEAMAQSRPQPNYTKRRLGQVAGNLVGGTRKVFEKRDRVSDTLNSLISIKFPPTLDLTNPVHRELLKKLDSSDYFGDAVDVDDINGLYGNKG